ncbi:Enriched in surface-labeled proteome protein 2 [Trypanosoma equiperdum]|uniref:Enriched in surface-labeled proteome protein 2 n=4 Tax=Trypanozoon TaxID=39700 RepID=Q384E6_TRYB2|nr:hypothetical protein, conserved [Trypanosoma brucei gambiense DAL972]XP_828947.1 hypothetical protein Tb11.12.0017 [Trypanosoma brucei brucei TREU927]RHW68245.1 Enriched in surface-labeled proteome protein 2 [Trypanosoma brucei equiperdum]SCU69212.1 Enriched in surface-labeled proteome protein 2 [Trypanosoma equiperdum]EAN79835.1 hypothetical protein Tb11.12.0017 [Trypanosoma brucei brucei TREU927]CBH17869.1 hypothetical protein, conserved [Trypanosoma brucei gambiense DAL972]|eukprot:XP_011780133.1 hypothetical protein, conserved [Trypanosoma brucei gambiense DAL972]
MTLLSHVVVLCSLLFVLSGCGRGVPFCYTYELDRKVKPVETWTGQMLTMAQQAHERVKGMRHSISSVAAAVHKYAWIVKNTTEGDAIYVDTATRQLSRASDAHDRVANLQKTIQDHHKEVTYLSRKAMESCDEWVVTLHRLRKTREEKDRTELMKKLQTHEAVAKENIGIAKKVALQTKPFAEQVARNVSTAESALRFALNVWKKFTSVLGETIEKKKAEAERRAREAAEQTNRSDNATDEPQEQTADAANRTATLPEKEGSAEQNDEEVEDVQQIPKIVDSLDFRDNFSEERPTTQVSTPSWSEQGDETATDTTLKTRAQYSELATRGCRGLFHLSAILFTYARITAP